MKKNHTIIIAEAGDNHNGDIKLAYKLIDVAIDSKADFVKFQTFKTESIISKFAEMAEYQKVNTGTNQSQFDMVKNLELPFVSFKKLKDYAEKKGIGFMSSPFDIESIEYLASIDMKTFKIPSGEITNLPFLEKIASYGKPVILSTGMCEVIEIENAINILKKNGCKDISLLHCNTQYPTPFKDVNLKAMLYLKDKFKLTVGYSDHTLGIEVPIAAVAMGAEIIEKHFTLDKNMEGPDHKASLEPNELKAMVQAIRNIEKSLGNGIKKPSPSETPNKEIARKSIVANIDVKKGEIFNVDNLAVKRPGNGISPMEWYNVLGKKAKKNFKKDELIEL